MDPIDLEIKPQVDRLWCWRERSVAAGTPRNSDQHVRYCAFAI